MSLVQNEHLTRQLSIIPMETLDIPITVIGCGAIGSFVALNLAKMGITNITVYDHDAVSVENMSNQFFRFSDIGFNKAQALKSLVKSFTGVEIKANDRKFDPDIDAKMCQGIVISAVDCMGVRKRIIEEVYAQGHKVRYVIDPRMSAEFFAQYCVNPGSEKDRIMYAKTLYSNAESVQERCTAKSTIYTATLAAGIVVKTVKNIITKQSYPRNVQWDIKASASGMHMFKGDL